MREYEVVYILDPTLEQEAVDGKLDAFHAALGGEITAVDHWGVRQLAYPMGKSQTGYYVIVHVTADPVALPEFERLLRLDEQTMRYLVVLSEGQPTSGASVLAERARPPAPEGDAPDEDGEGEQEGDSQEPGGDGEAGDDKAGSGEDEESAGEAEGTETEAAHPRSGPPEFSGARGRRRRHEGPPILLLNYKDVTTLSRFLTEQGKILPKRTTKVTARFQRQLGTAVKRARFLALLPYIRDHGS